MASRGKQPIEPARDEEAIAGTPGRDDGKHPSADDDTIAELLGRVLAELVDATAWDLAEAWLPAEGEELRLRRTVVRTSEAAQEMASAGFDRALAPGEELPGRAWSAGRPIRLERLSGAELGPRLDAARRLGVRTGVALPIAFGGEPLAVLAAFTTREPVGREETVAPVQAAADALAPLLQRRRTEEELRRSAAEAAVAEQRERDRLARDLHDDLGQILSLASMQAAALRDAGASRAVAERAGSLQQLLSDANARVSSLTFQLSPPVLQQEGIGSAVEWLADEMERVYGLHVAVEDDGRPKPLSDADRVTLFRAVRELLINVAKHAGAADARVALWTEGGRVHARVEDSGRGFAREDEWGEGFGLMSTRDRLRQMGGRLEIDSIPGDGTVAHIALPTSRESGRGGDADADPDRR